MKQMHCSSFGAINPQRTARAAVALLLLLFMSACGSDGSPGSPSGGGGSGSGGGPSISPGTMTATIDGATYTSAINTAALAASNSLVMSAAGFPGATIMSFAAPAQVGTHNVGASNPVTGALVTSPTVGWLAAGPSGSGSVTISTLTATSTTGTFAFTLTPNSGTGPNRVVSNGAFNARIPTP
jgi:hypothetical protein